MNKVDNSKIRKIIYIQAIIRGFLTRKKIKLSKCQTALTFLDDHHQNNVSNNNMDIISQSSITAKKENIIKNNLENIITNNLERNSSIMNFNPNVSKSIDNNIVEIQDKYLNINLVSYSILFMRYIT